MRIGIDARALTGRFTGDRTYWLNLIRALLKHPDPEIDYVLYTRLPVPAGAIPVSDRCIVRTLPASNDRLWTLLTFPRALKQDSIDIAHTQYTTPLHSPCPTITTVHDVSFRLYPEWFPRKHRVLLNLTVPGSMRRASVVITDSESSRRDIQRLYRLIPEKIVAIPLAAGPEYAPVEKDKARSLVNEKYGIQRPYVISVGVLQPRKNLPLLFEAFARARRCAEFEHELVVTGKRGWASEDLIRHAARLNITSLVRYTDYVPDAHLPDLYSSADLMAYPSLYEGFGLPPLEAMACATATVVSDAPAMPEVVGNGAMVLPAIDAGRWAEALADLLTNADARASLSERGIRRASEFSWERTATLTREQYQSVLSQAGAAVYLSP